MQFGKPSVSKMMTFWAPFRPIPPAMAVGKVMGEDVVNVRKVLSDVGCDRELVVAHHEGHGEAGVAVRTRRVHEVGRGDHASGRVGIVGGDLGLVW